MKTSILAISIFSLTTCFSQNLLKNKLEKIRKDYKVPGLAAAIIKDDKVLDIQAVGIRKVGYKTKLSINDKFHLGSNTKSMTATLAAILIEKGILSWDSKISELLPNIKMHSDYQDVTFELLLSHRSGLTKDVDGLQEKEAYSLYSILNSGTLSAVTDRELTTSYILGKPASYKKRSEFHYSNLGYIIAGYILERLTASTWKELISNYLFTPLGMDSCGFGETSNKANQIPFNTWGHKPFKNNFYAIHDDNPKYFGPAGNVHCSLKSWGKYLSMHLDGFNLKSNFLKAKTFTKLHQLYSQDKSEYTFGGWFRIKRSWANGDALTHSGTNTYNFARVWIVPNKNIIIMTVSNISKSQGYTTTDKAVGALIDLYLK